MSSYLIPTKVTRYVVEQGSVWVICSKIRTNGVNSECLGVYVA